MCDSLRDTKISNEARFEKWTRGWSRKLFVSPDFIDVVEHATNVDEFLRPPCFVALRWKLSSEAAPPELLQAILLSCPEASRAAHKILHARNAGAASFATSLHCVAPVRSMASSELLISPLCVRPPWMSGSALSLALAETATLDVVVQISLFTGSVAMSAQMPLWPERLTCFLSLLSAALLPAVEADVETARELGYLVRNFISKPGARSATATTVRGHTTSLTLQSSFSDSPLKALIDNCSL